MITERAKPTLDAWEKSFSQDGDCWSTDAQSLIVKQDDGGGGPYWCITTERWAFDSIADLVALLREAGVQDGAPTP